MKIKIIHKITAKIGQTTTNEQYIQQKAHSKMMNKNL